MEKGRLAAFSDGVFAIIITIMVLELKIPKDSNIESLHELLPVLLSYVLSFVYVGIYWNNHHHTFQVVESVNGAILWANMHLLFWLSLVPFVTAWMGENHFAQWPVTCYGIVLLMNSLAYALLLFTLIRHSGRDSLLGQAINRDRKGKLSTCIYIIAIAISFYKPMISSALFIVVACIWLIPDKRIEKKIIAEDPACK